MPQLPKSGPRAYLRRYTHLPAALHMLQNRSLTLLDPMTWDDSNDSFYVNEYKRRKDLKTTLAVCLSGSDETYHHWKVFAGHASGVCIRLRQGLLLESLKNVPGITVGAMDYRKVNGARSTPLLLKEFPFVKRAAFVDEKEVRVLYESDKVSLPLLDVPIPLGCIARITLSPWLPKTLVAVTKELIHSIEGCSHVEVVRSTIIGNEEWKSIARNAP
jgi:hypothetical protein